MSDCLFFNSAESANANATSALGNTKWTQLFNNTEFNASYKTVALPSSLFQYPIIRVTVGYYKGKSTNTPNCLFSIQNASGGGGYILYSTTSSSTESYSYEYTNTCALSGASFLDVCASNTSSTHFEISDTSVMFTAIDRNNYTSSCYAYLRIYGILKL